MKKIRFVKEYRAIKLSKQGVSSQTFKYREGDVLDEVLNEEAQWLIDNGFAEEVKESGWWKPKRGDKYWYIGLDNFVHLGTWENSVADNGMLKLGLIFKTEKAGVYCRDYLEAITTVRQDEGVLTPEQVVKDGYVYYICDNNEFGPLVYGSYVDCVSVNTILFDTKEHAQASRDKHHDEWKIIANYDWSRE